MRRVLIIVSIVLFIFSSCDNRLLINPVDPESDQYIGSPSVDLDGDGIGQYEDVDEIVPVSPVDGEIISQFPIVLSTNPVNPDEINQFWIQVAVSNDFSEISIVYENDEFTSNECTISTDNFLNGIQYYWRAKAFDGSKWSDSWSAIRSFTLDIDFSVPQVIFPLDDSAIIDTTPTIDWTDVTGATGYKIHVNTNEDFTGTVIADSDALIDSEYPVETELSDNTTYYWHVKIKNENGVWGGWSSTWNFAVSLPTPAAPSGLFANAVSETTVDLSWTDNSDDEDGFVIEYKEGEDGVYSEIVSLDSNIIAYQHTKLVSGTTYFYRVCAFNSYGDSDYSNELDIIASGIDYTILNSSFPTSGVEGSSFAGNFSLKNIGSVGDTQDIIWAVYRSEDEVLDFEDVQISTDTVAALSAGSESSVINFSGTWPIGIKTYYLIIELTAIAEGNTNNNHAVSNAINVAAPFIDYTLSNVSFPDIGLVNGSSTGSFTIENSGNIAGFQAINWSVYRSNNSVYDSGVDIQIGSGTQAALDAGQTSSTINFSGTWPGSTGTYYLIIVIAATDDGDSSNNQAVSDSIAVNSEPTGLSITSGPSQINENSSDDYGATLSFSDGNSQVVTPTWSENSAYASVNSNGTVTTGNVLSNQTFTLTATHSGFTATKTITIIYIPVVVDIDIDGPSDMEESDSEDYDADLIYDNGQESPVTIYPTWSENSPYASVNSNGLVTSSAVSSNTTFTLTASYSGFTDTKTITIEDEVISTPNTPSGPSELEDGVSGTFYTGSSSSNLGHSLQYRFYWGDGTYSSWSSSRSASHSWSTRGTKNVQVQARCAIHTDEVSSASSAYEVKVYSTSSYSVYNNSGIGDYPILDNIQVSSSVSFMGPFPLGAEITKVQVYYEIRHTYPGDLDVWVTAYYDNAWHGHIFYEYDDGVLGSTDDIVETNYNLFDWNGASPNQLWYLSVKDRVSGDEGYIDFFQIWVYYKYY